VKLSVKSDYAARAVLALARHYPTGEAQRVEDLAREYAIPSNYLVQILIELKSRNVVKSIRGKEGGYLLARPPIEITLGDILRCVHGHVFDTPALSDAECPPELKGSWRQMQAALEKTADSINFQLLLEQSSGKDKMYYI
jgi:Rrf2 family protein